MDIRALFQEWQAFWRTRVRDFWVDVRRLWTASRVTGASAIVIGTLYGLLPIAACIALFRLVDAVTGARGVRIRTLDFNHALWLLAGLWVGAMIVVFAYHNLRGVVRSVAARSAVIVFVIAAFCPLIIIAPWRTFLWAVVCAVLAPWMRTPRGQMAFIAVNVGGGVFVIQRLTTFLLSRSFSVGAFLLFFVLTMIVMTAGVLLALERNERA